MAKLIPLNKGKSVVVDDADFDKFSQWHWFFQANRNGNGYAVRKTTRNAKSVWLKMHREIIEAPSGMQVDHIDGNGLNNQRSNLRLCTATDNARNSRSRRGSSSEFKGVSWSKSGKAWQAYIAADKQTIYLGLFEDEGFAARVHDSAARKLHGEFARLNLPNCAPLTDDEIAARRLQPSRTSSFRGVSWHSQNHCWTSSICIHRKKVYLGSYAVERDAAAAYNQAAIKYHGNKAKLNQLGE